MAEIEDRTEVRRLKEAIEELRSCAGELRRRYGEVPAVRRIIGDVERLEVDAGDLSAAAPAVTSGVAAPPDVVTPLTDEPLDPALWADADDEGVGGYHRDTRDVRGAPR
jgi:hypothetical protein